MNVLARLKRRKQMRPDSSSQLHRCLGMLDLTLLSLGSMMGVGIYILVGQVSRDVAGPSVILSFVVAGLASAMSGLCYAEMAGRVPRAGSAYVYSYATVGEGVAFVIGWNLVLEYAIGTASVSRACTAYLDSFVGKKLQAFYLDRLPIGLPYLSEYFDILAFVLPVALSALLALGVKKSTTLNNVFTALNVTIVVVVTVAGLCHADLKNWQLSPAPPAAANLSLPEVNNETVHVPPGFGVGGFFPYGLGGTLKGAATCFYAFIGFDSVAASGEEAVEPSRTIPGAILTSLLMVCVMYVGVSSSLTLMVPYFMQDVEAPLAEAFRVAGDGWLAVIVSVGAVLGLSTNLIGTLFPLPRILYSMASDGLFFRSLASVHPRLRTPALATLLGGLFVGLLAAVLDLQSLVDMMSIGTLMAYTIVAVCILILRYENVFDSENSDNAGSNIRTPLLPDQGDPSPVASSYGALPSNDERSPLLSASSGGSGLRARATACFRQLLLLRASTPSSSICHVLIACISILCMASAMTISQATEDSTSLKALSVCLVAFLLALTVLLALRPRCQENVIKSEAGIPVTRVGFRVPLVPLLPVCSMLLNMYLTAKLSQETWVRFAVWMTVGILVYVTYGWRNSSEEYRARGLVPPNEADPYEDPAENADVRH